MLNAAILAKPKPEGGPMDLVIQMPLALIASGLAHGHFETPDFQQMGVYLIRHLPSNGTYVGSASGAEGLVGRWREYVETVHGGNKRLIELVLAGSTVKDFTVTALEITPNADATLDAEKLWKSRLLPSLNEN
jgi:hypothetical protein